MLVLVAGEPMFSESQLARALIAAESAGIAVQVLLNKTDLPQADDARASACALPGDGRGGASKVALKAGAGRSARRCWRRCWPAARRWCSGPSGMGKSTLINLMVPDAAAQVGEVSQALNSGRHTTTTTTWYWLDSARGAAR